MGDEWGCRSWLSRATASGMARARASASFDVIQLRGVFRQPFEGEPGARGERLCGQLAGVDRPVVENRDQGPGAFGGAVGGAKLVEQGNEVGGALGGAGMHEKAPAHRIKGAE